MAGTATPGPWRRHDTHLNLGQHTATILHGEGNDTEFLAWLPTFEVEPWGQKRNVWNDSRWIALMSPAVAEPLAAMLDTCAHMAYLWAGTSGRADAMSTESEAALAFARAITKAAER
jgi:hypothetical protein